MLLLHSRFRANFQPFFVLNYRQLQVVVRFGQLINIKPVSRQYLPQAFNLQNFAAISFNKGCYCGQEMVARAQYRGISKRALYLLVGQSEKLPKVGDSLEQKIAENWRETGCVTATLRLDDNTIWVQAILNNELDADAVFKVKNNLASQLSVMTINY